MTRPIPANREPQRKVILADRYGALYQQWIAEIEAELPPITKLLE